MAPEVVGKGNAVLIYSAGLKFGAQYEPRHAGVVGNVALASRTVGEAFEMIGRYLPTMVDEGCALDLCCRTSPLRGSVRGSG
jgi:hypothetical protein